MAHDPLDASLELLRAALAGNTGQLEARVHLLATDALEEANEMEEAADELGVLLQTLALASAETLRALATGLVAALAAAPDGSAIEVDLGRSIVVTAATDPDELVNSIAASLRP